MKFSQVSKTSLLLLIKKVINLEKIPTKLFTKNLIKLLPNDNDVSV